MYCCVLSAEFYTWNWTETELNFLSLCCHLANWTKHTRHLWFWPIHFMWKHDVINKNRKYITYRIAARERLNRTENLVEVGLWFRDMRADRQTDRHTYRITSHTYTGGEVIIQLEEASTHKSAKTNAGNVFVPGDLDQVDNAEMLSVDAKFSFVITSKILWGSKNVFLVVVQLSEHGHVVWPTRSADTILICDDNDSTLAWRRLFDFTRRRTYVVHADLSRTNVARRP